MMMPLTIIKIIILSFLGLAGGILALVLSVAAIALFTPVHYRAEYDKTLTYSFWTLAGILRGKSGESGFEVKVFWFTLGKGKSKPKKADAEKDSVIGETAETAEFPPAEGVSVDEEVPRAEKKSFSERLDGARRKVTEIVTTVRSKVDEFNSIKNKKLIVAAVKKMLREEFRALGLKRCGVTGKVGFDDPASTGMFFAAAAVLIPRGKKFNVTVEADFVEPKFEVSGGICGRTSLFALTVPIIKCVFARPVWAVVKPLLFKKKSDKNKKGSPFFAPERRHEKRSQKERKNERKNERNKRGKQLEGAV